MRFACAHQTLHNRKCRFRVGCAEPFWLHQYSRGRVWRSMNRTKSLPIPIPGVVRLRSPTPYEMHKKTACRLGKPLQEINADLEARERGKLNPARVKSQRSKNQKRLRRFRPAPTARNRAGDTGLKGQFSRAGAWPEPHPADQIPTATARCRQPPGSGWS